jgi:transposase
MEDSITLPNDLTLLKEMILDYHGKLSEKNRELKENRNALKETDEVLEKERIESEILTKEIHDQRKEIQYQKNEIARQHNKIDQLRQRLQYLLNQRYGRKSEKLSDNQLNLFDEADLIQDSATQEIKKIDEILVAAHARQSSARKPLPKDLPREKIIHDLSEEEKQCACGHILHRMGEDVSEKLEFIPAQIKVIEHIRCKYACRACEKIKMATLPLQPIPKSIASPGLLSHILISKYADHLPLYRQEVILQRMGVDLARATLCTWVLRCAELMEPLIILLKEMICKGTYVQADETFLQVLNEPNKSNDSKRYMWVYRGGLPTKKAVVYDYQASRAGMAAEKFLVGFEGVLQTDAYAGYNRFNAIKNVIQAACWSHVRRRFMDIVKISKAKGKAFEAILMIRKLYVIEKEAKEKYLDFAERQALRQERALPLLTEFKQWLDKTGQHVPPQSQLSKAISYALNQWSMLTVYVDYGEIEIDNNLVENAIRPFALGRKNWLFMGSETGARAGAVLYSLLATCKLNLVEPYAYFKYILDQLPHCKIDEQRRALLPQFVKSDQLVKAYSQSTWDG